MYIEFKSIFLEIRIQKLYLGAKYASNWNCPDFTWND